jgi:uncharacterized protein YecE (DUF72 family)
VVAYVGTSGFSYAEWKGTFYPEKLPNRAMLEFFSARLPTVELNNTFYRLPKEGVLEGWRDTVPAGFRFAVKAPKAITHYAKLAPSEGPLARFSSVVGALGEQLGPVLFQLPPTLRADRGRLSEFLAQLPKQLRVAFEFRHPSWFAEEFVSLLADAGCALVGGDVDEAERSPPLLPTTSFVYLRLRRTEYAEGELEGWAERIARLPGIQDSFVYFKHEQSAPGLALRLAGLLGGPTALGQPPEG